MKSIEGSTIAAIATPSGESGIGVIRLSGGDALRIGERIFEPASSKDDLEGRSEGKGRSEPGSSREVFLAGRERRMNYGYIKDPLSDEVLDEVLCVYMKAPHTYTTEDVVEIHCHGSIISLRRILSLCLREGAEAAEPGEFTKRAFLGGRLDLSRAEAVMDLVKARSEKGFDVAMGQLRGSLAERVEGIREKLKKLLTDMAVNMEYPDEDIEEITYADMRERLSSIGDEFSELLDSAGEGRLLREGFAIAIVGRPNVGKSSLLNFLLRENRAIVTDIPGTTRDTIEEELAIGGFPVRLIDTAGIREASDSVEALGIERSKQAFNRADIVILVIDAAEGLTDEDRELLAMLDKESSIVLLNKQDIASPAKSGDFAAVLSGFQVYETSVLHGDGMEGVKKGIELMLAGGKIHKKEDILLTNIRHINLCTQAELDIREAVGLVEIGEAFDIIEICTKSAFDRLGEITGNTAGDEIIEEIFSKFCLGK